MRPVKGNRELFAELKKLFPSLPDHVRSLSLHMSHDSSPLIRCEFYPFKAEGGTELLSKSFAITEITEKEPNVTECPRAVAKAT